MQKYKFRGKRKDNGQWVYGYYYAIKMASDVLCHYINDESGKRECEVIPETVGMYTGFKDCKGKEIYKDDILKLDETPENLKGTEFADSEDISHHRIIWLEERGMFYDIRIEDGENLCGLLDDDISWVSDAEVVGNVFDNPVMCKPE